MSNFLPETNGLRRDIAEIKKKEINLTFNSATYNNFQLDPAFST